MAKATFSLVFLPLFLLFLFSNSGGILKLTNAQWKTWCVAKPSSSDAELIANIEYACRYISGDGCNIINEGGSCYLPNTLLNHASVAMNLYYQFHGRNTWNCDFKGSALTTTTNPSYGTCQYA
ncbi:glucan endo-1,3-beta-D-glucosidase-like [Mangifera indica]|uniref:glucan endo-1,3-beta-D-glucosidase-like n=1 Tax=Mangifera indica TaxID=29780 RepID=UPI001CFA4E35|nr:glucan endo-1,3-beta-D-glucosidase-like [Mangifera indica]